VSGRPSSVQGAAAAIALLVAGLAALVGAGCGKKGTLSPNRPPETVVFVSGDLDTVEHIVRLSWFGTDPDGAVVGYEFKWIYEAGQAPAGYDSAAWFSTTRNESTFVVWTPSGAAMPTFVVRAIDDEQAPDPTPARQDFLFRNLPPTIVLTGGPVLPATTFPVATVRWLATDPDGDVARATTLLWLDGDEATPTLVPPGSEYTIPPAAFSDGAGGFVTGPHTVYVRAVDDGGAVSLPDSFTWNVVAPEGEVLLVDDVPSNLGSGADSLYRRALNRQIGPPPAYSVINLQTNNPFRSAADLTATFGFFRSVVWYQENNTARSAALPLAEPAIRSHLAQGGNFFLSSTIAVGSFGALSGASFLDEIVGADSVRFNEDVGTTAFSIGNGAILRPGPAVPYDSLLSTSISSNVDALVLRDLADAAFLAPPIVLDSSQVEDWIVGVDRVPDGGSGRFVFVTFPLRFLGGTPEGAPPPAPDTNYAEKTIRRVLFRFGHGTSP
jgi:hypothetical protein